jgi:hypothetical protein
MYRIKKTGRTIVAAMASIAVAAAMTAPSVSAEPPPGQQEIALHNDTATNYATGDEACSFAGVDTAKSYWHFVLAPNNASWEFATIHLVTTGDSAGSDFAFLPNGNQYDNVFVEIPSNMTATDLVAAGSYAWIDPDTPTPQNFLLSHTCTGEGSGSEPEISVVKTVTTRWDRTHEWDLDKVLVDGPTPVYTGELVTGADFVYRVDVTELSTVDAYGVSGSITVSNGNDVPATITDVTDTLPGFDCTVDDLGANPVVVDGSPLELAYTCDPLTALPEGELTNTATVSYSFDGGSDSATSDAMPVVFSAEPDHEIDADPVLTDDQYSGVVAGENYTIRVPASVENCTTGFTNTATLTGDDESILASDEVTVSFCVTIGGRTIGFWSNNNGRAALTTGTPTIWTQVKSSYPNITQSLVTVAELQSFLVAKGTNCSTNCVSMLRAQFIATALNSVYIADYGTQAVAVPNALDTVDGTVNGCATVNDLLASVYAQYPFGTTAERVVAKTTLDTINQQESINPFQCTL